MENKNIEKKFMERIEKIRNILSNSKKTLIFFDTDTDGITSFFQLRRVFPNIIGFPFFKNEKLQKKVFDKIKKIDFDVVGFFDTPKISRDILEKFKEKKIIWVDHHLTYNLELEKKYDLIIFNPLIYKETEEKPTTFLTFLICDCPKENLDLVNIGSIADFFLLDILSDWFYFDEENFSKIFNLDKKKILEILEFIKKNDLEDINIKKRKIDYISSLTFGTKLKYFKYFFDFLFKLDLDIALKALEKIEKFTIREYLIHLSNGDGEVFSLFQEMLISFEKTFQKVILDNKGNTKKYLFFEYKNKENTTRMLCEKSIDIFKEKDIFVIAFLKKNSNGITLSFRSREIDVNDLIKKILKNLSGNGGGHKLSAGCFIEKKDYSIFKERLFNYLEKI